MGSLRVRWKQNDEASAGGLAGMFILFIIAALFIVLLAPVVDQMNDTNNAMSAMTEMPVSQDRTDTLMYLESAFAIMAFMILLAAGINYWVNSIREQSSEV